jgi:hypothetical protein
MYTKNAMLASVVSRWNTSCGPTRTGRNTTVGQLVNSHTPPTVYSPAPAQTQFIARHPVAE